MTHQHQRIYTFDLLRGLAVLAMILAHSVYFLHSRESAFLLTAEGFGNIVSFVTFLLVSGAVAAIAYVGGKRTDDQGIRRRIVKRVLLLLLAYYVLAFILTGAELLREEGFSRLQLAIDLLTFRNLPGFMEYFPPFIFYSALLALVPRWFHHASRTLKNVVVVSLASLLAGMVLNQLPVGEALRPWAALLAGAEGLFRFPLLQYLPVFLLGMYWGHRTLATEGLSEKRQLSLRLFWFFAFLVTAALLAVYMGDLPLHTVFSRWPPSVPFLSLGLGFAFLMASLLYALHQLRGVRLMRDTLLLFGQNALGLFWSHIFLLGLYAIAGGPKISSHVIFFFSFLLLLLLSLALTTFLPFNFRLALTKVRGSQEEREDALHDETVFRLSKDAATEAIGVSRRIRRYFFPDPRTTSTQTLRRRHKLSISLILLAAAALVFPPTIEELALQRQQRNADIWWSDEFAYRQEATLHNTEPFLTVRTGAPTALQFNHKTLVEEGKSRADGQDVRLVYWSGDGHIVAESFVEHPATEQATLTFRAPVDIEGGSSDRFYYLYYGGAVDPKPRGGGLETSATVTADFGGEEAYPLVAAVSKTWNLIGADDGDSLSFHLDTPGRTESQTVTYEILGTDLAGAMLPSVDASWDVEIPIASLAPGAYRIQATLHTGGRELKSQQTGFYRSYPLYVAWTNDWEGYDANQAYLDAMEAIADQYDLPITHFFNPRIYVTDTLSPQRAQSLTQWVQRRIAQGDGYGLHLHMHTDFVEHAGIEPKEEPNWGDRGDGYGVIMAAYTEEEQTTMIRDAVNLMVANGFARPVLFRAGGWYANLDTLAALEELGFTVDSSARTAYQFGRNKVPGFWSILPTTRPYRPSRSNQNSASLTNAFPILEIPDNGADSYAFSAEEMIGRFTANMESGILVEKQQLTFLSHPHWFDEAEQARIRELFSFVSRYTFADDQGPVVFTTTKGIADIWTTNAE